MSTTMRARAERVVNTAVYGVATGAAGALVGAFTGGLGWALLIGGAAGVAGGKVGSGRPDSATRANARLTKLTSQELAPLTREGWYLLHGRAIGQDEDRVYHLCVPPTAHLVVVVMNWAWPQGATIFLDGAGELHAGGADASVAVDWVLHAADTVDNALKDRRKELGSTGIAQVLPVHDATVDNNGHVQFHQDHNDEDREINIVQGEALLDKMRTVTKSHNESRRTRRAAHNIFVFLDNAFPLAS
ncbi:hypothetical protein HUT19_41280 (plasmid) [Streptomyces sp. NA02950]|uniref:hypothetical protein n=1 Tax=Streptomyces sp. NA02950 TaxID=2742137 RepID=UPI001591C606|nr:hypothetical protein [Streptomyces sp. NA02950]QKV98156.1 hypothetical protein HUT19_41280 [Streptomyces sp. NA02950]